MKTLLISANTEKITMPTVPIGLGMVAGAARRAGHEVALVDLMFAQDPQASVSDAVSAFGPEVIGVSVRNIDDQTLAAPRFLLEKVRPVIQACRTASNATIILGGAGYSIFPDECLTYLDADLGVAGEGELAFPMLLDRLAQGTDPAKVPGVHVAGKDLGTPQTFSADLDALPLPEHDVLASQDPNNEAVWVPVESRRGCANGCSYCSTAKIQGRDVRARSADTVAEHLRQLQRRGFSRFYIVDNALNIPESHGLELCRAITGLGLDLAWRCILYPHRVSEQLVRAMAAAGCKEVALGFESGSQRILTLFNKRFGPQDVRRTSELLADHGIFRRGFLLLGGPGETRRTVEQSLAFADSLGLEGLKITVGIRIYPGTPLAALAREHGMIATGDNLLFPRFYLAPEVDPWIRDAVKPQ